MQSHDIQCCGTQTVVLVDPWIKTIFPRCKFSSFETLVLNGWCGIMANFIGQSLGRNRPSTCQKLQSWVAEETLRHCIALGILCNLEVARSLKSTRPCSTARTIWMLTMNPGSMHLINSMGGRCPSSKVQFESLKFFIYLRKASMDIAKFDRDGQKKYRNCWPCSTVALACSGVWPGKSHAQSFAIPNKDFTVPTWQVAGNNLY